MRWFGDTARWIAVMLSPEGTILSLSGTAEQLTGYSADELTGRPLETILGDDSPAKAPQILRSAAELGLWEGCLVHRDRSGNQHRAQAALTQLSAPGNRTTGLLLLSSLESESKDAGGEELIPNVAAHLRETVHELNNPLAIMMGFTQLMLLDPHCRGKLRSDVERLFAEMKRVIQAVEDLHEYALGLQRAPETGLKRKTS